MMTKFDSALFAALLFAAICFVCGYVLGAISYGSFGS
jgi:ABC-type multidrug transport system permease subunit